MRRSPLALVAVVAVACSSSESAGDGETVGLEDSGGVTESGVPVDGGTSAGDGSTAGGSLSDCPAFAPGNDFRLCAATYLTDGSDDVPGGVAFGADGAVLYAGSLRADNYGKSPTTVLGGGAAGVLRLAPNGRAVLSVTRIGSKVTAIDARKGPIATTGGFGLAVLEADGSKLIFSNPLDGEGQAVAVGEDGTVAVTHGAKVSVFDAMGTSLGKATFAMNREHASVAIDAASKTVIVAGFNQRDGGGCTQLQVPFMHGFAYDGTKKWTNYDFTHAEVAAVSECADSRAVSVNVGRDGKLYLAGRSDGGNTVFNRMPRNLAANAPNVAFDNYTNPFNMNGAASVAYIARFDASTGALEAGQRYVVRLNTGKGNTMRANDITATADGTVFVGGDSACCMPNASTQTVNGAPAMPGYAGGGYVLIIPKDFKSRSAWTVFRGATGDGESAIGVATDGKAMAVLLAQSAKSGAIPALITASALQPAPGGGMSDAWLAVWRAP